MRVSADEHEVFGVGHPGHRPERGERLDDPGTVAGFFLQFADSRIGRFFAFLDQAARQLPAPAIRDEPVPPEHQHLAVIIDQHQQRGPRKPGDVMPVPLTAWQFDVDLNEPNPRTVVDLPLAEGSPPARVVTPRACHNQTVTPPEVPTSPRRASSIADTGTRDTLCGAMEYIGDSENRLIDNPWRELLADCSLEVAGKDIDGLAHARAVLSPTTRFHMAFVDSEDLAARMA